MATRQVKGDYVAKFQATKVSWKGSYQRILALANKTFESLDPSTFVVTNTYTYKQLVDISLDPKDLESFNLTIRTTKDESSSWKCKYRTELVGRFFISTVLSCKTHHSKFCLRSRRC